MPRGADLLGPIDAETWLKVLLWSDSGTGKTTLLGTAMPMGEMYVFDFDLRLQSLAGMAGLQNLEYDSYRDVNPSTPMAFENARKKLDSISKMRPFPYKVVAVDSLTTLAIAAMWRALPIVKAFMPNLRRLDDFVAGMPDYQASMSYIEQFMSKLITLPCHVIVTAHEDTKEDPITEKLFKNLAVSGKLATKLPQYFNELWRMEVTNKAVDGVMKSHFKVVTRPDHIYKARTCYPEALMGREDPNFIAIIQKVNIYVKAKRKALPPAPERPVQVATPPKSEVPTRVAATKDAIAKAGVATAKVVVNQPGIKTVSALAAGKAIAAITATAKPTVQPSTQTQSKEQLAVADTPSKALVVSEMPVADSAFDALEKK